MKVLFATYPMAFHTPGGGEVQLLAYKDNLQKYDIDVTLFDPWNPQFMEHDLVHFFSCVGGSSHFCSFVKKLGLPLVISSSLWITEETKNSYPIDEIKFQLEMADKVIANSDIECRTLSKVLELDTQKFSTVYNGVPQYFFQPSNELEFRKNYGIESKFFLNIGNIEPRKNQLRLAHAMKHFPEYELVLIGHVRDGEYLREVLEVGGNQVKYLGVIPHTSPLLRSAYKACELFVLPSTLETPGLAAIEAVTVGARLVLTEEGSCQEYFGSRAVYVNPMSIQSIIDGINGCLSLSKASLDSFNSEKFLWGNVVERLANVYKEVTK